MDEGKRPMGDEVSRPMNLLIVTGSRADYGHLKSLLKALSADARFKSSLLVTGSHLHSQFGMTANDIVNDGFIVASKIEVSADDSSEGIAQSLATVISKTSVFLAQNTPDAMIVYGDRWEMFGAATAATISKVPLIHIGGGDITEGAYDESFRHAMTKMSAVHFVTHDEAKKNVLQMGEDPKHVYNVGSLAIDSINATTLLTKEELEKSIGFSFQKKNILVTYHPTTLLDDPKAEISEFLNALSDLPSDIGIIITKPSLDTGSIQILSAIEQFTKSRPGSILVSSLGLQRYLSAVSLVDVVVGNSSSGVYEVPSFNKPTVNVGDRQGGRSKASSVIDVPVDRKKVTAAIMDAIKAPLGKVKSPYGDGNTAKRILETLASYKQSGFNLKKAFFRV